MLVIEPKDDAHKLLMKETKWGKRCINILLSESREVLANMSSNDSDGHTLALCSHEVSALINIGTFAEIGEDFRIKDIDMKDLTSFLELTTRSISIK